MRLMVLAGPGRSTNILLNWLVDQGFRDVGVIIEESVSRWTILRNRRRKLGTWTTLGQVLFQVLVVPILNRSSRMRAQEILADYGLRDDAPVGVRILWVKNINEQQVINTLREQKPDLILVNGTRILRAHILNALECPVLNTHAGITPTYRGVHGGFWALWSGDKNNFGVTIHLVDTGVDTGKIVEQIRAKPTKRDNFVTYPLLQQALSFTALKSAIFNKEKLYCKDISLIEPKLEISRQWYHPTLWQYIAGVLRGVR